MHSEHMVHTNGYDSYLIVIDRLSHLISLIWLSNNFIVASILLASEVFPDGIALSAKFMRRLSVLLFGEVIGSGQVTLLAQE